MKRIVALLLSFAVCLTLAGPTGLQAQDKGKSAPKPKLMNTTGLVKSVSGNSVVVNAGGKDLTFTIDDSTTFVGKGLSTKSATKKGKMSATDAVAANDRVTVAYHDMNGTLHAQTVTVTDKAKK